MSPGQDDAVHLSVVAPAFNEVDNLPQLIEEIAAAAPDCGGPWEIVIADDASDDGSVELLRRLMGEHPQLRVLEMRRRSGQSAAMEAALRAARGRYVATLDADCQNDPADIPRLLKLVAGGECDLVNGWRKARKDTALRRLTSRLGNGLRNWLTREDLHDSGCGLKVFRRECVERMKLLNGMHRFFATLVRMEGYRVREVVVNHRPRTAGVAKYGFWNRFFRVLRDAVAVRWMQARVVTWQADEVTREPA
jgi:dolichol-phosphate mannosyltransferase